jgi:hypothetical protein
MTLTDYILDIGLIAIVLLQVRGRRLTTRSMLIPIAIVAWAADNYLHGIPTAKNDLVLVVGCTLLGAILGTMAAVTTKVFSGEGSFPMAKAGFWAAAFWIVGVGTRFAFQLYASHGGDRAIGRFSASHGITSPEAWTAALVLMAIGEVATRTVIIGVRGYNLRRRIETSGTLGSSVTGSTAMMAAGDRSF